MNAKEVLEKIKKHWYYWIIILLILIIIALGFYMILNNETRGKSISNDSAIAIIETTDNDEESIKPTKFYVEVKGYVKKPNVYEVEDSMIINDVIKMAGGFKTNAYTTNINLSKKLVSEMVIYVYSKTEYAKLTASEIKETCSCPTYNIENCVKEGSSTIIVGSEDSSNNSNKLININTATKDELLNITGIGESKASNIIGYRESNGLFKTIEDIMNVSGIGESIFNTIKKSITV